MPYKAVSSAAFAGGLVLATQPDAVAPSQAIDLLNVSFGAPGAVGQRDGYAKLTTTALTNPPDSIGVYETSGGTKRLVVGNGNRLDVLTSFPGATAANTTAPTASPHFFARYGGPTAEVLFIANGTDQIRQLSGTTFSTPAGLSGETGKFVAVWQNRLVVARESGTTAGNNVSSVRFSDPADPTNFTANAYEDLHPGDGEAIMGMAVFRDQLIVFKQSKFFVFYGIGSNAAGEADPEWRAVEAGAGLAASRALAVARDGLYFLDRQGVYRTDGREPKQVSEALDPFFVGGPSIYFRSSALNPASITAAAMGFWEERLYLAVPTGAASVNDRVLVHDPRYGWWGLDDLPVAAMCVFSPSNTKELVFATTSAIGNHVARHAAGYTADNMATDNTGGTAIVSRWRSGFGDFGDPNVKRCRERKLWGEGSAAVKVTVDGGETGTSENVVFGVSGGADVWTTDAADVWTESTTDVWGGAGQTVPRMLRAAQRGTTFSIELSNQALNTTWVLNRLVWHLADFRVPSVPKTEVVA